MCLVITQGETRGIMQSVLFFAQQLIESEQSCQHIFIAVVGLN